ncbi:MULTISPECIES: hypothetical protein [unclassified Nitratiruptor]|uniref:hypothetical protein n=1 Tax=unclassified Nitratiruptor TaxID=2624044 RepID=UPI0019162B17|nr:MULTISPECIES: hypothetical protein [unclassified Nitratiruptor]BCD59605.1 hypothetical protein NitYY0810_C0356 [Nitratiruptor sp. YY08-10]BCD63529.1 hypothetical protein NitYY0814_C0356 [Nitratiruptor sp. YY08-14]BCD83081.1 hypothetical protein NrS2_31 [Nitratiruptor phage NrS-2]BCD83147.1 hypothetical protein NrS3_31 [Nitratiruptor phage NrS-3]
MNIDPNFGINQQLQEQAAKLRKAAESVPRIEALLDQILAHQIAFAYALPTLLGKSEEEAQKFYDAYNQSLKS